MELPFEMDPTPPPALPGESMTQANFRRAATLLADLVQRQVSAAEHPEGVLDDALVDFYTAQRNLSQ